MSTDFRPLEIPPGVVSKPTKQMRSSNWAEVNLMRWVEGQLAPVGGQAQYPYAFASRCKKIHGWFDLTQVYHVAYLCEQHLYVDTGGTLVDISPMPPLVAPGPVGAGGYGDGAYSAGTYGTPRPLDTISGLDKIPDAFSLDNFGSILYAMTSPDGRLLMWDPGLGSGVAGATPATAAFVTTAATISIASGLLWVKPGLSVTDTTNGKYVGVVLSYAGTTLTLTANAANAGALNDQLSFSNIATVQPPASGRGPVPKGRGFVVTNERFIWIYGSGSDGTAGGGTPRRFNWCDQENPGAWDYSNVTSQAGFLDIEPASPIITAIATRNGVLFWTGKKAYVSQFLGLPYVYNYAELSNNCTPWSCASVAVTSSLTLWMSKQGFFSYDGTSVNPVACQVRPWIDDDIDPLEVREQACLVHVADFNEVWWFFPQKGQPSNTRCAIYSYKEGWWSQGQMARSAGITASYNSHTIMADGLYAYEHEAGNYYPQGAPLPWAETYDLNLTTGVRLITVKQMQPDVGGDIANLLYSLFYRMSRSVANGQPVVEQQTPPKPVRPNGFVDFRTTGRDIRLRIGLNGPAVLPVTVGQHLIDAVPRGDR